MIKVFLKRKIAPRIANGHPWVYGNEIDKIIGEAGKLIDVFVEPGTIVDVHFFDNKYAGRGYINQKSQIAIRLLSRKRDREEINQQFFYDRILKAWQYRQKIGYTDNCRLVFGEADYLPALIIDKFNDYFVIQTLAYGIEVWKPAIVEVLQKIFNPKGIYERNDVPVRELEGLQQQKLQAYQQALMKKAKIVQQ